MPQYVLYLKTLKPRTIELKPKTSELKNPKPYLNSRP
jgi:hypothetical protein